MKLAYRSKIYGGLCFLLMLFGGVIYLAASRILSQALLEENRSRGLLIASNLAVQATEPILAMDFLRLKDLVDETVHLDRDVYYAFALNAQDEVLAHTFPKGFPIELKAANTVHEAQKYSRRLLDTGRELLYDFAVPVMISEHRFGTVRLGLLRTRVEQAIQSLSLMMLLATTLVVALSGLIGALLARAVGKPIESLHRSIEQVMRGDLDVRTAPPLKRYCWDIMGCAKAACPAYNESHLRCWYLAGTLCPTCVEGEYAKKIDSCLNCPVHKACSGDEIQQLAESFDFMARTLKDRLSDLKAAEATLTEQQHLLRTILNATPDFVGLQDRDSVYRVVNRAFCELAGRSEEAIVGKTDLDLFPRRRAEANRDEDLEVLKSGVPLIKENRIRGSNGERWIHLVKLPVRDGSGAIVGLLCSGRDITDFKKFQERLTQAQKMESVGQLTAGIAHEINTPLGIILGYAQLLIEETDPGGQIHEDLKIIEKHTQVCRKIVSDLLRFSRHTETSMASLDVNRAIEEALAMVEHTFRLERVKVERRLGADLPEIVGDGEKLKQAIVNLLNNAFDAIGADGLIVVSTAFSAQDGAVLVSVADTGNGIPPENIDKVFDPFFTTKGVGKGTGLGLSVSFGIVKDHGGKIEVQSPLPVDLATHLRAHAGAFAGNFSQGSVFTMVLPARVVEVETDEEEAHGNRSGSG
jgi:two-component system NtrC family sensor kinase